MLLKPLLEGVKRLKRATLKFRSKIALNIIAKVQGQGGSKDVAREEKSTQAGRGVRCFHFDGHFLLAYCPLRLRWWRQQTFTKAKSLEHSDGAARDSYRSSTFAFATLGVITHQRCGGSSLNWESIRQRNCQGVYLPDVTTPIATSQTDSNGRYTLQLPANAAGKDVVVIAEKSVEGRTLRLSNIAADVPKEGKVGVNLDAATTLATEQIVFVAKKQNISDFSANAILVITSEV